MCGDLTHGGRSCRFDSPSPRLLAYVYVGSRQDACLIASNTSLRPHIAVRGATRHILPVMSTASVSDPFTEEAAACVYELAVCLKRLSRACATGSGLKPIMNMLHVRRIKLEGMLRAATDGVTGEDISLCGNDVIDAARRSDIATHIRAAQTSTYICARTLATSIAGTVTSLLLLSVRNGTMTLRDVAEMTGICATLRHTAMITSEACACASGIGAASTAVSAAGTSAPSDDMLADIAYTSVRTMLMLCGTTLGALMAFDNKCVELAIAVLRSGHLVGMHIDAMRLLCAQAEAKGMRHLLCEHGGLASTIAARAGRSPDMLRLVARMLSYDSGRSWCGEEQGENAGSFACVCEMLRDALCVPPRVSGDHCSSFGDDDFSVCISYSLFTLAGDVLVSIARRSASVKQSIVAACVLPCGKACKGTFASPTMVASFVRVLDDAASDSFRGTIVPPTCVATALRLLLVAVHAADTHQTYDILGQGVLPGIAAVLTRANTEPHKMAVVLAIRILHVLIVEKAAPVCAERTMLPCIRAAVNSAVSGGRHLLPTCDSYWLSAVALAIR